LGKLLGFGLGFGEEGFVGVEVEQFEGSFGIAEESLPPIEAFDVGFVFVEFLKRRLGLGLIIPKGWLGGNLF
jgi:hypothetical protein